MNGTNRVIVYIVYRVSIFYFCRAKLCPTPQHCYLSFRVLLHPRLTPQLVPKMWKRGRNVTLPYIFLLFATALIGTQGIGGSSQKSKARTRDFGCN